jgi:Tfp pilus assembly PilM family ATPase
MNILTVDIGSYSVKFLEVKLERKSVNVLDCQEVIIAKVQPQLSDEATLEDIQYEIINSYLKQSGFEGKIMYQLPCEHSTSRFLDLPVNNRKKAELMIPFQLDENLPYQATDIHYTSTLMKKGQNFSALINIAKTEYFDQVYSKLQEKHILPALLTTELSVVQSAIDPIKLTANYCILDIGHETTKAYFIHNKQIISNHTSHIAGKVLDNVIAQTYNISLEDASIYKHENCFFLTDNQYNEVDKDQQEFAKLMKQSFWPFILELRRWELGFRVKVGQPIERIYITGGTSKINNINNFISQSSSLPVEPLRIPDCVGVSKGQYENFGVGQLMAISQKAKTPPANFLVGDYSSGYSNNISLHSSAFIVTRVAILCVLIITGLLVEQTFFLKPEEKVLDKKIQKLLKNQTLRISQKVRRKYKRNPERILSIMSKKNKQIKQEIKTIMSAAKVNAVNPLSQLSDILKSNKLINLDHFKSSYGEVEAIFTSQDIKELEKMKGHLESFNLTNLKTQIIKKEKSMKVTFDGE